MLDLNSMEAAMFAGRTLALLTALGVLGWACLRWRRAAERDTQRLFEQVDMLTGELNALTQSIQSIHERIGDWQVRLESQSRLAPATTGTGQRGYEFAMRLAKNGASREDLVTSCGISRHEAELLVRLHGPAAEAAQQSSERTELPKGASQEARVQPRAAAMPAKIANPAAPVKVDASMPRRSRLSAVG